MSFWHMLIYIIQNKINGKYYLGKTVKDDLNDYLTLKRWQVKNNQLNSMPILMSIKKNGWDNFDIRVLAETDNADQLSKLEQLWIALLNAQNPEVGYNINNGGAGGRLGVPMKEETKRKIGAANSIANKGKTPSHIMTQEHREKIRQRMMGNNIGKKFTSETARLAILNETSLQRSKRAAAIKAAWDDPIKRARIILARKESKAKKKEASFAQTI